MTAIEEAEAYLASRKQRDLSQLSDEEIIRNLPDEVLLQHIQQSTQPVAQEPSESPTFLQALGLGLRDTGVAALQGVNAATGGFLKAAYEHPIAPNPRLETLGYTPQPSNRVFPTPITPEGKFMGAVDTAIGTVAGLPGRAFTGATKALTQIPKIPLWVAQAGAGAAGGLAFDVAQPETYGRNAALGAAGSVVIPPVFNKAFKMFQRTPPGKLLSDPEFEQLAGTVRQAVGGGKLATGIEFDEGVTAAVNAKPDVATPATDFIESLKSAMKSDATFAEKVQQGMLRSAKQGNTTLQAMLGDEARAATANGRDLQNIKQTLQSIPSIDRALQRTYALQAAPKASGRFDAKVSDADLTLIDHISDLRGRILSAYPELGGEYARYAQFMEDYRTLAPRLRTGTIESTLLGKYGNALQRQAAGRILPSEILQQVEQVRTQQQTALEQMRRTKEFHRVLKQLGYDIAKLAIPGYFVGRGLEAASRMGRE